MFKSWFQKSQVGLPVGVIETWDRERNLLVYHIPVDTIAKDDYDLSEYLSETIINTIEAIQNGQAGQKLPEDVSSSGIEIEISPTPGPLGELSHNTVKTFQEKLQSSVPITVITPGNFIELSISPFAASTNGTWRSTIIISHPQHNDEAIADALKGAVPAALAGLEENSAEIDGRQIELVVEVLTENIGPKTASLLAAGDKQFQDTQVKFSWTTRP